MIGGNKTLGQSLFDFRIGEFKLAERLTLARVVAGVQGIANNHGTETT
jgi:hypothetical protein